MATPTQTEQSSAEKWRVRLSCCGRDDGEYIADSWEAADQFREAYTSGPGVNERGYSAHPSDYGHRRAGIVEKIPSVPPADPICTAREALHELLHLVSDPVKDWTDERAMRATMLSSRALRDLRDRPQGQLRELAPPQYEYAEVERLEAVNERGRDGWRVHTADPASEWYLLERIVDEPAVPAVGTVWSDTRPAAAANVVPNLVPPLTTHTVTAAPPTSRIFAWPGAPEQAVVEGPQR